MRGLYAITDSALLADGKLVPFVAAALEGGAQLIQYRDKSQDPSKRLHEATQLAELCQRYGAHLIINDDLALAAHLGVGLHLGQEVGSVAAARERLGDQAIIGATCHASLALAQEAYEQGASYLAFGRFFNSHTKPGAPAAPLELLAQARARFALPLVAIGGVNLENAPTLITQGADLVAVVHSVFAAPNAQRVQAQARALSQLFHPLGS